MQNKEAESLLIKYREGKASEAEIDQLLHWLQSFEANDNTDISAVELEAVSNEMWQHISKEKKKTSISLWPRIAVAASIILCFSVGGYLLLKKQTSPRFAQTHDVAPGTNKAILKIGNGRTIILDNTGKGLIAEQGNTAINKTTDGQVEYSAVKGNDDKAIYDTLQIPAGGKIYQLKLADGSKVVLNAATTLRFPEHFTGNERAVELINGEAYFEVIHNKKNPFTVHHLNHTIEDIGTQFNVNAYDDEPVVTTLLQGSVKVAVNAHSAILKPSQQSVVQPASTAILVKEADTEEAVAWKEGLFMFNEEKLSGIMRQISRWYDVEVVFKDPTLQEKLFSGSVSRFGNASQVLSKLALTGSVHFKITGRRIEVMR